VTPWSGLPVALPPWHTSVREPKLAPADVACDVDADADADADAELDSGVLLDPARLQPAAIRAAAAMAAAALSETLTGFLLGDDPRRPRLARVGAEQAGQDGVDPDLRCAGVDPPGGMELCEGRHTAIVARILPIENDVSGICESRFHIG